MCEKLLWGSSAIRCHVAPLQHVDRCQGAAKWHFQSSALLADIFNNSPVSSRAGMEAAASCAPPSPPGLQYDWPYPEIWGIWSKGDGEGERPFAKLLLQPLLLLRIQVGPAQQ